MGSAMIRVFFSWLWSLARHFPTVGPGIRFGSGASVLLTFLFLVFFIIGLALMGLGFDLDDVDAWLHSHDSWIALFGDIILKGLGLLALVVCAMLVAAPIFDARSRNGQGGCLALVALVVGYFCVIMVFVQ